MTKENHSLNYDETEIQNERSQEDEENETPFSRFSRIINEIYRRDLNDPRLRSLQQKFEKEGEALGRLTEDYYAALIKAHEKKFGLKVFKAPLSLDYYDPKVDLILLLEDGTIIPVQMYSPKSQSKLEVVGENIVEKYYPAISWRVNKVNDPNVEKLGEFPVGFVSPSLTKEDQEDIYAWRDAATKGRPWSFKNSSARLKDFFSQLAESLSPENRVRLVQALEQSPHKKIPMEELERVHRDLLLNDWFELAKSSQKVKNLAALCE